MSFNYFNIAFEILACVFRAIGARVILLPIAGFLGFIAMGMHDGLILILGLMATVMTAIMAAVAVFAELEQAMEEVRAFRYWRAASQNA